jgi:S-DNA-T family DNA segregation ATPase FtsK/SpoIIIE
MKYGMQIIRRLCVRILWQMGSGIFLCGAGYCIYLLFVHHHHDPSLLYADSATVVSWSQWLGSSCAALLYALFGCGAWLVPLMLAYGAVLMGGWYRLRAARTRLIAFGVLIGVVSLWNALGSGVWWHDVHLVGGILGSGLRALVRTIDPLVVRVCIILAISICITVITQLAFVPVLMRGLVCAVTWARKHRVVQRTISVTRLSVHAFVHCVQRVITFVRQKVRGACAYDAQKCARDSDDSIDAIVRDVFWQQCKKTSGVEPSTQNVSSETLVDHPAITHVLPPQDLLDDSAVHVTAPNDRQQAVRLLEKKLAHFDIHGHVTAINTGPVVTCFEYEPTIDTKISKILALENDLALALQALSLRIIAPIPGTNVVGFEVARTDRQMVSFAHLIRTSHVPSEYRLPLVLGCDVIGQPVIIDLARCPHLLMAGATGSGKSIALHTIILSLLFNKRPDQLQLVLIDPKRLELQSYEGISHMVTPVIHDAPHALCALEWVLAQMHERYERMAAAGVRTIDQYPEPMPAIVVIIDELADLMMVAGSRLEMLIARIAQMARAAGIHLVVATQRPSVDVITGLIKVNFVSRIALRVTSAVDSRVILDEDGAQRLIGAGDMLMRDAQGGLHRVHGAYVRSQDINSVVTYLKAHTQQQPASTLAYSSIMSRVSSDQQNDDPLYQEVINFLKEINEVSISLLQRKFKIGFNRSARIIDELEAQGRVVRIDGGKTRKVVRSQ